MCGGKTEQMINIKLHEYHNSLQQFSDAIRSAVRGGMVQLINRPIFREMARQYVADQERKGLPKKTRHHDHLLERHIRLPYHR